VTDKISALLHVWEADCQELAAYEALTPSGSEALELRAKGEQLKACIEQLRMAVAVPLPPDTKKRLEDWLENRTPREESANPKPKVFFLGHARYYREFCGQNKLQPQEVVMVRTEQDTRGWHSHGHEDMSVYVHPTANWASVASALHRLERQGFTKAFIPAGG
jgi:hypothetical protein